MWDVSFIHQQNAHVHIITNTGKACSATEAQILYFVWLLHIHAGHLCKRYPHFFSHSPTSLATTTQPAGFSFFFFYQQTKKYCHGWKKYPLSACALDRGRGDVVEEEGCRGRATALALCCMKYLQLPRLWDPIPSLGDYGCYFLLPLHNLILCSVFVHVERWLIV